MKAQTNELKQTRTYFTFLKIKNKNRIKNNSEIIKACLNEPITIFPALNWTIGIPEAPGKKVSIVLTNSLRSSGFDKSLLGKISTRYKLLSEIYLLLKFSGISLDKLSGIEPRFS